jgi:hypothetical protein
VLFRFSSTLLAALLAATLLWGRCACCVEVFSAPPSQHDCCKRPHSGDCGTPAPKHPAGQQCPRQTLALENYTPVEPVTGQVLEFLPSNPSPEALPEAAAVFSASDELPLVHAPPDLYLLNSVLLI